jgi:hypothetical protein
VNEEALANWGLSRQRQTNAYLKAGFFFIIAEFWFK